MSLILQILVLMLGVGLSSLLVRALRVPLPFVQIGVGVVLSLPLFGIQLALQPDIFLLLFVAPLLFVDGYRIPKREFFASSGRILALAFGLVFVTVLVVGWLIHWLLPSIPLPAAFALAAILSPTDAVAVSALTERVGVPRRLLHLLQGEALMNDASGLTAFNVAIAAALTGVFSLPSATLGFIVVAVGGVGVGSVLGLAMSTIERRLVGWRVEEQAPNLLLLLLPFAAYLAAEHLHVSGILAAVAAGIVLNLRGPSEQSSASARLGTFGMWSMIEFVFNGLIFVVLGLQLRTIVSATAGGFGAAGEWSGMGALMLIAVVILVALMALRFTWVWISVGLIDLKARRHGRAGSRPHRRLIVAMALAGVRGAVTLAGVLSVPLLVQDGSAFPSRELMVFIAAAVILLSLVIAAIGLPIVLKGLEITEDAEAEEERIARKATAEAAIRAIEAEAATLSDPTASSVDPSIVAGLVIGLYQRRLDQLGSDAAPTHSHADALVERRLRVAGLHAERAAIGQLRRARRIDNGVQQKLLTELDLREAAIVGSGR